jgi:hypothetical protein
MEEIVPLEYLNTLEACNLVVDVIDRSGLLMFRVSKMFVEGVLGTSRHDDDRSIEHFITF